MTSAQIRELSASFELGAHTLTHRVITRASDQEAWQEIAGSKSWLENLTGTSCLVFCPPRGDYASRHLSLIRRAGYIGLRSVEFGSLDPPRLKSGVLVMPTTIQAHSHHFHAFAMNMLGRAAIWNFWRFIIYGRSTDWPKLTQSFLRQAARRGGVFHLWGHSWELQERQQWSRLEEVLRIMCDCAKSGIPSLTNGQICQQTSASAAHLPLQAESLTQTWDVRRRRKFDAR
jgi:hypothetical protein